MVPSLPALRPNRMAAFPSGRPPEGRERRIDWVVVQFSWALVPYYWLQVPSSWFLRFHFRPTTTAKLSFRNVT